METILQGWVLTEQGEVETGTAQMRQAMARYQDLGWELGWPYYLALLARAHGKAGEIEKGLTALTEGLATVRKRENR